MQTMWQDLRYCARMLVKKPGFTLIAVMTLALGIGVNTAVFSLVNAFLFRPLPVEEPERLVGYYPVAEGRAGNGLSYPYYRDVRDRNNVFSDFLAFRFVSANLSGGGRNEHLWGYLVSGNYFDALGVKAGMGRVFTQAEDRAPGANPVIVISHGCWRRRFGADPNVVGAGVSLNGHKFTVIGVTAEGFFGTERIVSPEFFAPMMMQKQIEPGGNWLDSRGAGVLWAAGRLKPGVTTARAEAALNALTAQMAKEFPDHYEGMGIKLDVPGLLVPDLRVAFLGFAAILLALVGVVLLIACVNLANLLLARATERGPEIAIRLAIGASRWRLIRQLLTESLALSVSGGSIGLLMAVWIIDGAMAFKPTLDFPLEINLALDWRVLGFAFAVSVLTGMLFGLAPAMKASRPELTTALKGARPSFGHRRSWISRALVVAQVALSLLTLIASGLIIRSLANAQKMYLGFNPSNVAMSSFDLSLRGYDSARGMRFYSQLIERAQALPGVRAAAVTTHVPLGLASSTTSIEVEGQPAARGANKPSAMEGFITPDYFAAMEIPLLIGRSFNAQDSQGAPLVVIVNEAFARRLIPGAGPVSNVIGKRIKSGGDEDFRQIAGVVKDGKYFSLGEEPTPFIYFPITQKYSGDATLIVRAASAPEGHLALLRREVNALDPNLPVYQVGTLNEHLGLSLFPLRVAAALSGSFGLLALILAVIGIYGVMNYAVMQRTREIGIRMALGARPAEVFRLIAGQGMALTTVGLVIGIAAAFGLTRLMSVLLYGVSATDPLTFILISSLLAGVALLACWIPARLAAKVDPMIALRCE
ncbi:MAG: ABC transporter permease [Blastocatellia bacterium]